MNELVKRVDPKHRRLDQFFHEEFTKPLGRQIGFNFQYITLEIGEILKICRQAEQASKLDKESEWKIQYIAF